MMRDGGRFTPVVADRSGVAALDNDRVDFNELLGVSEKVDPQERRRRNITAEPADNCVPGVEEVLVLANDVDRELTNVVHGESVNFRQGSKVVETGNRLLLRVADPHNVSRRVAGHLTRHKQLASLDLGVSVAGCRRKTGADLVLVHGAHDTDARPLHQTDEIGTPRASGPCHNAGTGGARCADMSSRAISTGRRSAPRVLWRAGP